MFGDRVVVSRLDDDAAVVLHRLGELVYRGEDFADPLVI